MDSEEPPEELGSFSNFWAYGAKIGACSINLFGGETVIRII